MLSVAGWSDNEKLVLVRSLWSAQTPAVFFTRNELQPPALSDDDAAAALQADFVDYLAGRCMKTSFTGDMWDMSWYDRSTSVPAEQTYAQVKGALSRP